MFPNLQIEIEIYEEYHNTVCTRIYIKYYVTPFLPFYCYYFDKWFPSHESYIREKTIKELYKQCEI